MKQEWNCMGCGKRSTSKDGIEQDDGVYFVVCAKCGAQNKIAQTGGGAGAPVQFTIVSLIPVRAIYATEAFLAKRRYEPGKLHEALFPNLEDAKKAVLPEGYTFAMIDVKDGRYLYSPTFGWQFES